MTAQEQMIAKYGMPGPEYEAKWCMMWQVQQDFPWFLVPEIFINKDFQIIVYNGLAAIEGLGLQKQIVSYDGCLSVRPVRGSNDESMHAWAGATDWNRITGHMIENLLPSQITMAMRRGPWTEQFIDCMTGAGAFFGGFFKD